MTASRSLFSACRLGSLELFLVWSAIIFIKRDLYFKPGWLDLDWHQIAACALAFAAGALCAGEPEYGFKSPFRKKVLRFVLPAGLFFYTACASLCLKLNILACGPNLRCAGLVVTLLAIFFLVWTRWNSTPRSLRTLQPPSAEKPDPSTGPSPAAESSPITESETSTGPSPAAESSPATDSDSSTGASPAAESSSTTDSETSTEPSLAGNATDAGTDADVFFQSGPWGLLRYPYRTATLIGLAGQAVLLGSLLPVLALPGLFVAYKWEIQDIESYRTSQFGGRYLDYRQKTWALIPYLF